VTRSGRRAQGLVAALHAAGAHTVAVPLTEQVGPLDGGAALRDAAARVREQGFRWIVFTSVNAVRALMAQWRDARALGGTLVAAVGPATAAALRAAGVEPDLVPADPRAAGLVAAFEEPKAGEGSLVLFPCADLAPSTVPDALAAMGWEVRRVEAYRTVSGPRPEPEVLEQMAAGDAVIFAAPSAAEAHVALVRPDGSSVGLPPVIVCIGPSTAARARALGMRGVVESPGPSPGEIVGALIGALIEGPGAH